MPEAIAVRHAGTLSVVSVLSGIGKAAVRGQSSVALARDATIADNSGTETPESPSRHVRAAALDGPIGDPPERLPVLNAAVSGEGWYAVVGSADAASSAEVRAMVPRVAAAMSEVVIISRGISRGRGAAP